MKTHTRRRNGYTFAEVLVASALLGMVIGGTTKVIGTMNTSETAAVNVSTGFNMVEVAGKLWQLGLSPTEVYSVLPSATDNSFISTTITAQSGNSVSFGTAGTYSMAGALGTLESITCTVIATDPQGRTNRSSTFNIYRPTFR